MDVEELAAHMRQEGDPTDQPASSQRAEAGIAVGVHPAGNAFKMRLRMRRFTVGQEPVTRPPPALRRPQVLRTAMATPFFWPTSTCLGPTEDSWLTSPPIGSAASSETAANSARLRAPLRIGELSEDIV